MPQLTYPFDNITPQLSWAEKNTKKKMARKEEKSGGGSKRRKIIREKERKMLRKVEGSR
jgi:hypothetical protein